MLTEQAIGTVGCTMKSDKSHQVLVIVMSFRVAVNQAFREYSIFGSSKCSTSLNFSENVVEYKLLYYCCNTFPCSFFWCCSLFSHSCFLPFVICETNPTMLKCKLVVVASCLSVFFTSLVCSTLLPLCAQTSSWF